jgi:antitoxin HigA-1
MASEKPGFRPVHPGRIVKRNLEALEMTVIAFADHIGATRQTVHAITSERSAVTAEMAAKLAKAFKTSARFWTNMQANHDVWEAERKPAVARVRPIKWTFAKIKNHAIEALDHVGGDYGVTRIQGAMAYRKGSAGRYKRVASKAKGARRKRKA